MSRITSEVHAGWREPFLALANMLRTPGHHDQWWRDWDAAVAMADRSVRITGWSTALQPGFDHVDLGMQPVFRPARRVDRSKTRVHFYARDSVEARELSYAQLTVSVQIPREWTRLPRAVFRLRAVSAILDALLHLGESRGIGPPPVRTRPTEPGAGADMDYMALVPTGHWWDRHRDQTPVGYALVAARPAETGRRTRQEEFLARLGDVERLAGPGSPEGDFVAWRVGPIVDSRPRPGASS